MNQSGANGKDLYAANSSLMVTKLRALNTWGNGFV